MENERVDLRSLGLVFFLAVMTALILSGCGGDSQNEPPAQGGVQGVNTGTLDTSFNGLGYVVLNSGFAHAMTLDSTGNVLVAGSSMGSYTARMTVWRVTSSGAKDLSLGGVGYVTYANTVNPSSNITGSVNDYGLAITVDANGKILVAGSGQDNENTEHMIVWRLNPNGSLDTSFNGKGFVSHGGSALGFGHQRGYAISLDAKGNILVAGSSSAFMRGIQMSLWRITPSGELDATFGSGGQVTHGGAAGGLSDSGYAIAVDAAGRTLVAGTGHNRSNWDMTIWRFMPDGSLDTSFNGTGFVAHDNAAGGNGDDSAQGIAVDGKGRVVVTGHSRHMYTPGFYDFDMVIWRYTEDGQPDMSIDGRGYTIFDVPPGAVHDYGNGIALDRDGNIVVAGESFYGMIVWQYTESGALDTRFNKVGYAYNFGAAGGMGSGTGDRARAVTIDRSGRVYATGESTSDRGDSRVVVWRYR